MNARADGDAGYPARWQPSSASAEAASFARQVVAACGPHGRDRAKNLLWAAGKLAGYGIGLGLEPVPAVLLHPSVIERFTAHAPGLSGRPAARCARTCGSSRGGWCRTWTRRTRRCPASGPRLPIIPPRSAATWRSPMPSPPPARRMRAAALVCLGAGAGLIRADLRNVRGTDIGRRCGGVIVTVRGGRAPRAVPVLARYHARLLQAAEFAGGQLLTGGTDPARHNISNPLTRSLAGGSGLPPLDTSRLRATWLAECAQLLGLATFLHAAGITCSQRLGDIIAAWTPAARDRPSRCSARACGEHPAGHAGSHRQRIRRRAGDRGTTARPACAAGS